MVGTLNTLYTAEQIQGEAFDYEGYDLPGQLRDALVETWDGLVDTFSLSVLANPVEASMADGDMETGSMGTMASKFGSPIAAYSYLVFVLLYVPCVTAMGAIARESSKGWMAFSVLWGLNVAYSLATLCYQVATFAAHPERSVLTIAVVLLFNLILMTCLRLFGREQVLQLPGRMADAPSGQEDVTDGDTHADPRAALEDGQARGLKQLSRQVDAPPALVESDPGAADRARQGRAGGCAKLGRLRRRLQGLRPARSVRGTGAAFPPALDGLCAGWRDQARVG